MSWKKWKKNPMLKAGLLGGAIAGGTILSGGTLPLAAGLGLGAAGLYQQYKNFDLQQKNSERQWDSYQEQMSREDTSVARRVQDLKAAGLSPVLAAGSGATSQAVFTGKAPQMENPLEPISGVLGLMKMKEDITTTVAQQNYLKAQAAIKWHDYEIFRKTGTPSNAGGIAGTLRNIFSMSDSPILAPIKEELKQKGQRYKDSNVQGTWRDMFTTPAGIWSIPLPKVDNKKQGGSK